MSLATRCKDAFGSGDRQRGSGYFKGERVDLFSLTDQVAHATVAGHSGDYTVDIGLTRLGEGVLSVACDCPRYYDGYPCKHVWASLLEFDDEVQLPGGRPLELDLCEPGDIEESDNLEVGSSLRQLSTRHDPSHGVSKHRRKKAVGKGRKAKAAPWVKEVRRIQNMLSSVVESPVSNPVRQLTTQETRSLYVLCQDNIASSDALVIHTYQSNRKKDGDWSVPQKKSLRSYEIELLPRNHEDRKILDRLVPRHQQYRYQSFGDSEYSLADDQQAASVLAMLAGTGRLMWSLSSMPHLHEPVALVWDDRSCRFGLNAVVRNENKGFVSIEPVIAFDDGEPIEFGNVTAVYKEGIVLIKTRLASIEPDHAAWTKAWQQSGVMHVPIAEFDDFLTEFTRLPSPPPIDLDETLKIDSAVGTPVGHAAISKPDRYSRHDTLTVQPKFKYGDEVISLDDSRGLMWNRELRQLQARDVDRESELLRDLGQYHFETVFYRGDAGTLQLSARDIPQMTYDLVEKGWEVVAHGKLVRNAGSMNIRVKSDNDWFDMDADVDYQGVSASLPSLLRALQNKESFVQLDDGTQGILPEKWLERYARFAQLGDVQEDSIRFAKPQALLLDAMLSEQEGVDFDRDFTKLCKKMREFDGIKPGKEPRGFDGELRQYQRDGVGWFGFLRGFQFGGCLADDMGLGKTVQVLALLQSRRTRRLKKDEQRCPSLVVVPKSLVFNWIEEAGKFAPRLNVLNYTGLERKEAFPQIEKSDVVITTYGTLRRDIALLREKQFDYLILDEAQAVKNASSQAAKSCRLIKANHRLAMTGTPVENHLGELWSLFDFLNPGMLGNSTGFRRLTGSKASEPESLDWLARAIRPFILRRTKQQVLPELPEKTEQTLHVDMTPKQAKKYAQLRDYYRANLSKKVDEVGIKRSKIHVLEALLRLRQAACDPRLLGEKEPAGAKLELLVEQLESLQEDGHKALIFSQFTSLLALVRKELDDRGWNYEYLDGKTRKRQKKVERFQNDEDCRLFLISLKAGGSGLNLTAADYVFILDPWWNPAVEAQAIDRAHRIGQTKSVMAYRIICNDTVEDKIVKLQESKRGLADAIITADKSLISEMSLEDLQMLLT